MKIKKQKAQEMFINQKKKLQLDDYKQCLIKAIQLENKKSHLEKNKVNANSLKKKTIKNSWSSYDDKRIQSFKRNICILQNANSSILISKTQRPSLSCYNYLCSTVS